MRSEEILRLWLIREIRRSWWVAHVPWMFVQHIQHTYASESGSSVDLTDLDRKASRSEYSEFSVLLVKYVTSSGRPNRTYPGLYLFFRFHLCAPRSTELHVALAFTI